MEVEKPDFPFLSSRVYEGKADVTIFGLPLDVTETFRSGASKAPSVIRKVSDSIESYSPFLKNDLEKIKISDRGDLKFSSNKIEEIVEEIENWARGEVEKDDSLIVFIGGEHTITYPLVKVIAEKKKGINLLHLDAHLDMRDSYEGKKISHATVMRRISEIPEVEKIVSLGIRSGSQEDYGFAGEKSKIIFSEHLSEIDHSLWEKPFYLTLDIDVLDPSCAPGTGNPEPGGPSFKELAGLIYSIPLKNLIAFDIVEVSPPHDSGDITSITAAKLIREIILKKYSFLGV
jgi:agmatinase